MKSILLTFLISFISSLSFAQQIEQKNNNLKEIEKTEKKSVQQSSIEIPKVYTPETKEFRASQTVFYIINDKPATREEYLLHLRDNENKNKEQNPKP